MKTINIKTDSSITAVPVLIPFQGSPTDDFINGEEIIIQLINNDGYKVGEPEVRSVVKTHDADINESAWYEAYIPAKKS
ncbi:hypothetical protein CA265_24445 [Sphingobacteriaceae bacterium GW460-11-11-14-LB5]|nr:hypothetical protein CA265_24445 [Sphingobacteriaceae bacterium GW460-11-11-14-LB5]